MTRRDLNTWCARAVRRCALGRLAEGIGIKTFTAEL